MTQQSITSYLTLNNGSLANYLYISRRSGEICKNQHHCHHRLYKWVKSAIIIVQLAVSFLKDKSSKPFTVFPMASFTIYNLLGLEKNPEGSINCASKQNNHESANGVEIKKSISKRPEQRRSRKRNSSAVIMEQNFPLKSDSKKLSLCRSSLVLSYS